MPYHAILTRGLITEHVSNIPIIQAIYRSDRFEWELYTEKNGIFCHFCELDFELFKQFWPGEIQCSEK